MKLSKIFLSETTRPSAFIFNIYNIIKRSFTKIVQIMPLGFSIIGSTVTFSSGERPRALWALLLTLCLILGLILKIHNCVNHVNNNKLVFMLCSILQFHIRKTCKLLFTHTHVYCFHKECLTFNITLQLYTI